jgi:hypothetical protein
MTRYLLPLSAVALVVGFGLFEGTWTERWHHSNATSVASDRLSTIPLVINDWHGQEGKLDERQMVKAELTGALMREYVRKSDGVNVMVLLVCGRPGPVSLHTPDVCFQGSGHALIESPAPQAVREDRPARFNVARFRKGDETVAEYLRAFWGWSADGEWSAPAAPRLTFARAPALYKLYVIRQLARPDEPFADDPSHDFLRAFLPEARKHLFPAAGGSNRS